MVYTDRIEGGDYNRVLGADARLVFGEIYTVQLQAAGSRTRAGGEVTTAPLWQARFTRNGRTFGFRTSINASDEEFRARSGFFPRPGLVHLNFRPRATIYGEPRLADGERHLRRESERALALRRVRRRRRDPGRAAPLQRQHHAEGRLEPHRVAAARDLRLSRSRSTAGTGSSCRGFGGGADTVAFVGRPRIPNRDYVLSFETPEFKHFSGNAFILWGNDENFFEWSPGRIIISQLRGDLAADRASSGSTAPMLSSRSAG